MSGSVQGGKNAAATNKAKHGPDFYREIGRLGGKKTAESGKLALVSFASNHERAREAGRKGGKISKRRPAGYVEPAPTPHTSIFSKLFGPK